jgi:hypothetical protein
MLGGQQLHLMPQRLQRSGLVVCPATGLQRDERPLTIGKEGSHPVTPEFVPRDFAGRGIHDVQLKHALGNIHSDDWQRCGRLHGGASGSQVVATNFHFGTLMPLPRGPTSYRVMGRAINGGVVGDVHAICTTSAVLARCETLTA